MIIIVPWKVGAGGCIAVWNLSETGRVKCGKPDGNHLIAAHNGKILDFKFSPFHEDLLVTGGEDAVIKVWKIPQEKEWKLTNKDAQSEMASHTKKVHFLRFHPLASHVLISGAYDGTIKFWDLENSKEVISLDEQFGSPVMDLCWNYDGSLFASAHQDKKIRLVDPRQSAVQSVEYFFLNNSCLYGFRLQL